ncbi:MAG TPA: FecR domain-containing protein, partial [Myxococcota bacterium]|nr:FecR domain-containing protein [Myxococcota bacterium]
MSGYSCHDHRAEAPERLAGELSALGQERFDGHQRACAPCRGFVESLAGALAAARAELPLPPIGAVDRAYVALMDRLRAEEVSAVAAPPTRVAFGGARRWWPWAAAGAVTAGAAAALALFVGLGARSPGVGAGAPDAAWVSVSPRPGLDLRVASGTDLSFEEPRGGTTTLVLRAGTLYARVAPLPPGRTLVVRAPDLAVRVVGTIFMVRSEPGHPSEVAVMRGAVAVERSGAAAATLLTGEAWRAPGPASPLEARDLAAVRDWLAGPAEKMGSAATAGAPAPALGRSAATAAPVEPATPSRPAEPSRPAAVAHAAAVAPLPARALADAPTYAEAERVLAAGGPGAAAEVLEALVAARPDGA